MWIASACSCGDGEERARGSGGSMVDSSSDETSGGGTGGAGDSGKDADGAVVCLGGPKSPLIPKDWKRFPGLPCDCDVWFAPDETLMAPAPAWITTPPGVLEMENNWADYAHRFSSGVGDSWQGKQHLGYLRDLGNNDQEAVIVRLPENQTVFQARIPGGGANGGCRGRVEGLSQNTVLYHGRETAPGLAPKKKRALATATPPGPVPKLFYTTDEAIAPYTFAVSNAIASYVISPGRIDAFRLDGTAVYNGAWVSTGPPLTNNSTLLAWDDAVFFSVSYAVDTHENWIWDAQGGARPFVPVTGTQPGQVGSTCPLGTDGKVIVWTQLSGWTGNGWQSSDIMVAPYTTDSSKLAPKKLRSLPAQSVCIRWKVQAGYAGTYEDIAAGDGGYFQNDSILVRLSDGVMWTIPKRPGRYFGVPLYITETEVALEESFTMPSDAGVTEFESWSIVRYPIALLGPGTPP